MSQPQPYPQQQPPVPAHAPQHDPNANNARVNITEKKGFGLSAGVAAIAIIVNIFIFLTALGLLFALIGTGDVAVLIPLIFFGFLFLAISTSFIIQSPGEATVLEFFGQYLGTVRRTGLVLTFPFLNKRKVLVRTENFETPVAKVNDSEGNPINISSIVVWRLKDTAKATYAVENYQAYLRTQAEAAVRHVAAEYPYDSSDGDSLLKSAEAVNTKLAEEVALRAEAAGIDIIEVRINNLSYSVEIAQAMLQRQQASAILSARKIIVDGAVGIVEQAVENLAKDHTITEERKANLIADLLVVLVSESKVSPVLEVGKKL